MPKKATDKRPKAPIGPMGLYAKTPEFNTRAENEGWSAEERKANLKDVWDELSEREQKVEPAHFANFKPFIVEHHKQLIQWRWDLANWWKVTSA